jgi:hypothetical protein
MADETRRLTTNETNYLHTIITYYLAVTNVPDSGYKSALPRTHEKGTLAFSTPIAHIYGSSRQLSPQFLSKTLWQPPQLYQRRPKYPI